MESFQSSRKQCVEELLAFIHSMEFCFLCPSSISAFNGTALPALKFNSTVCPFWKFYSVRALGLHFYFSLAVIIMATKTRVVLDLKTRVNVSVKQKLACGL
jgi:hypothetical protein